MGILGERSFQKDDKQLESSPEGTDLETKKEDQNVGGE